MLSVIIPARDEEGLIVQTGTVVTSTLRDNIIPYEVIVVDDGSKDNTRDLVLSLSAMDSSIQLVHNVGRRGFGMAIRAGLRHATGEAVAITMADGSDSAQDLVTYYREFSKNHCCVFGSRFIRGAKVVDVPVHRLLITGM